MRPFYKVSSYKVTSQGVRNAAIMAILIAMNGMGVWAEELSGKYYSADGVDPRVIHFWIPDGVPVLRGFLINGVAPANDEVGHDKSRVARVLRFGSIHLPDNPRRFGIPFDMLNASQTLAAIASVAKKSNHPELVNLPMIFDGQYDNGMLAEWFPGRIIAMRYWSGKTPANIPMVQSPEEGSSYIKKGEFPFSGAQGSQFTFAPQWGWGHGYYSMRDLIMPWDYQVVKARVPADWDPLKGKPTLRDLPASEAWYGDPSTWYGDWPIIASSANYKGDKNKAVWLPNEYTAWLWRAYASRHPTKTRREQGEGHVGDAASTYGLSGRPDVQIISPIRSYDLGKLFGKNYPLVKLDTVMTVQLQAMTLPGITKVEFFDGNRLMAEHPPSAYGIYQAKCKLSEPGIRAVIAIATFSGGVKITSRPAVVFVSDWEKASASTSVPLSLKGEQSGVSQRRPALMLPGQAYSATVLSGEQRAASLIGRIYGAGNNGSSVGAGYYVPVTE